MLTRIINRLEEGFIALLLALMTLVTFSQVIARYFFNTGASWALELTTYLFAWLVLFGVSYGVKVGSHIGVDVLVRKLPAPRQRAVGLATVGLCALYCVILFIGAVQYVDLMYTLDIEAEDLPIPLWVPTIMLPIGFALTFLRLAQVGWRIWSGQQLGMQVEDEAAEAIEHFQLDEERHAHVERESDDRGEPK